MSFREKSNPSAQLCGWPDVTAPNPDRAATSKWTSFKLVPYKGVSATTRKGHNINSEVQASPPALKESRAISAADREQAGIA